MSREVLSVDEVEALGAAGQALEADPQFRRLGALLCDFNVFEALGMVRQELRHSHWLAFLLHPGRSHGLGTSLLRALCQDKGVVRHLDRVLQGDSPVAGPPTPTLVRSVRDWDWSRAMVLRESEDLDLLVVDPDLRLALIIENKIDASEHDDHLARYFERVGERYPGYTVAGLFLTPQGNAPSDKRYLPVSYTWICQAAESVLHSLQKGSTKPVSLLRPPVPHSNSSTDTSAKSITTNASDQSLSTHSNQRVQDSVRLLPTHYIHLLRRHIVDYPELPELCNELYARHAPLLDLLFEHRGDDETRLYRAVQALVKEGAAPRSPHKLVPKSPRKTIYPKFELREWEALSTQANGGEELDRSALYFEFTLRGALRLSLLIGPYYPGKERVDALRGRTLLTARNSPHLFTSGPFKSRTKAIAASGPDGDLTGEVGFHEVELDEAEAGIGHAPSFDSASNLILKPNPTTTIIWRQTWISPNRFKALSYDERLSELERRWDQFVTNDLPLLRAALPAASLRLPKSSPAKARRPKSGR